MKRPGAVAVSPDGRWIVAAIAEPAYDEEQKRSDLWIVPSDGSAAPRRLTAGKGSEGSPAFSPDSTRLAFSAKREGDDAAQVYVLELAGGEAQRVTNWVTGARAPRFSPDGRSILFVGLAYPGAGSDEDNRKAADERKARKYNVRTYDSFPIRHWDRWLDDLRPTLVVQPLDGTSPARDLLAGSALRRERGYGGRLGNEGETLDAAWTPDGNGVVFAATTNRHEAARAEVDLSLWLVSLAGGEPRRLTGEEGDYASPDFTPDGSTLLAKVQPASKKYVYTASRLVRWSWPSLADRRVLTADIDVSVGDYSAAPDNRRVFFLAERDGHERLFEVPLAGGTATEVGALTSGTYSQLAGRRLGRVAGGRRILGERGHAARNRPHRPRHRPLVGAFDVQYRARGGDRPVACGGVLVHVAPRQADPQLRRAAARIRSREEISAVRADPRRAAQHVEGRVHRPLELPPARAAGLRRAADELQRLDGLRRGIRARDPGRSARRSCERDQPGRRRGDQALFVHRRITAGRGWRELRRAPVELARSDHGPLQGAREPRGSLRPAQPVDDQRRGLQPREEHRRAGVEVAAAVARAEPVLSLRETHARRSC